ncbi:MAG: M3 family oligoendopeptidase [Clostridia bacterium]|nr:M3 family oligoendopeptidase [Clostridia bacterium]
MIISDIKYQRINKDQVIAKSKDLIDCFKQATSAKAQKAVMDSFFEYLSDVNTMFNLSYVRFSLNTNDEFYAKEQEFWNNTSPELSMLEVEFARAFLGSKYFDELKTYFPPVVIKNFELVVNGIDERIIPDMQQNHKVVTEYTNLINNVMVDFRGEKYTLASIAQFFTNDDRNVRREASIAYGNALNGVKTQLDEIYDRLVKIRTGMSKKLDMDNFVELGYLMMKRNSYDKYDIEKFRNNVKKHIVPAVAEIKEMLRQKFGWDKIYTYDNNVYTEREPRPIGTPEEIFDKGSKMYAELSPETSKLFDRMRKDKAFDVLPKKGKFGGGYCISLDSYRTPFILANFNGSAGDVEVLTHEFGHALAAEKAFKYPSYEREPAMETCEVHSMSMEFLTYPWMELFFGDAIDDFKFQHIATGLAFIPYGTIVDYFQTWVYENPEATPAQRNQRWLEMEHEFLPHLSFDDLPFVSEGRRWQRQMHIYESPFYYIDYCLAQFTAFQFLALSLKDFDGAFNKYMKFVSCAGSMSYTELIDYVGLKSPFDEQAFIEVIEGVKTLLK